ncbi:Retrotransposable element Tf2 [Gossypium australe]|uniref:Retrotransposable element Tf2 n=1 Tax=Gossypium australe TaxID=47621 RepID=A0A5B6WEI5_9ROSI|nr:Retrotransposable element Tf2 [Gossypium australe]
MADALSRKPSDEGTQLFQCPGNSTIVWSDLWEQIIEAGQNDHALQKLCQKVQQQPHDHPKYFWDGTVLQMKENVVVGNQLELRKTIFQLFHGEAVGGHSGVHATRQRISKISKDIKTWVRECSTCQKCKSDNAAYPSLLQPLPIPNRAWAAISLDFIKGLPNSKGKTTILVIVDRLTKYGHFIALTHLYIATTVAQVYLDQMYKLHGAPESIVSYRDRQLFKHLGTKLHFSTAYHPQTDGKTKVLNKCLEGYLRCMTGERPSEWSTWLHLVPPIHLPYLAGSSPVEKVDKSLQYREDLRKLFNSQIEKDRTDSLKWGDLVYLRLQPYPVEAKIGGVAYKLKLLMGARIHSTFHVSQLKKHTGSATCTPDLPPGNQAVTEVLVEWADKFPEDATWEVWSTLQQQYPTFDP